MSKATKTEITETQTAAIPVPAYLQQGSSLGNEQVGTEGVEIPRISLVQQSSKCVDPNHKNYVEGVKPGHFLNSLTKEFFSEVYCINMKFEECFVVWAGGGKLGEFKSMAEAQQAIDEATFLSPDEKKEARPTQTHRHLIWVIDPETNTLESMPYILDFASSKMRVSKSWNSNIAVKGYDRFSHIWRLSTVSETKGNNSWLNLVVEPIGYVQEQTYIQAKEYYERYLAGDNQQEATVTH